MGTTQGIHHLTNSELIAQLTLRTDLTEIEHELLDRLMRAEDALRDSVDEVDALHARISDLQDEAA